MSELRLIQQGTLPGEHFRLNINLKGEYTDNVKQVIKMIRGGLYIVNPFYKMTDIIADLDTDDECYERYIYVEDAEIDAEAETVTFFNGDGWEYIVKFDDVVGTLLATGGPGYKRVIVVLKGVWDDGGEFTDGEE